MSTKEANYSDSTVREAIHKDLDEKYSKRNPELEAFVRDVDSDPDDEKSKDKGVHVSSEDGALTIKTDGKVTLDRDGWLHLSKVASKNAQATA